MREYKEIQRDTIAEIKRLGSRGYSVEDLRTYISEMTFTCTHLEHAAKERITVTAALSDAAKEWPHLNQPDEPTAAEATVDIEKIAEAINRQIQVLLTRLNAKEQH